MNARLKCMRGIARIVEVSLVSGLPGMAGPLWDLCEYQVEFGNVLQRSVREICHFVSCIRTRVLLNEKICRVA